MIFKYYILKEEIYKREISLQEFAKALGVPTPVLSGNGSPFPMEKLEMAIQLLNDWRGPTKLNTSKSYKPKLLLPVTKEMLVQSTEPVIPT